MLNNLELDEEAALKAILRLSNRKWWHGSVLAEKIHGTGAWYTERQRYSDVLLRLSAKYPFIKRSREGQRQDAYFVDFHMLFELWDRLRAKQPPVQGESDYQQQLLAAGFIDE